MILVEPFAGMAALSFWTMGTKPPISWMGGKSGYAHALADIIGLSRHNPPAAYIWGDVGPNVAALATLAGARGNARDVAGWLWYRKRTVNELGATYEPAKVPIGTTSKARLDRHVTHYQNWYPTDPAGRTQALPLPRAAEVAAIIRTWKDEEPRALWTRLKAAGWPSLMPPKGMRWGQPIVGRWLGPCEVGEVAGWMLHADTAFVRGQPGEGINTLSLHGGDRDPAVVRIPRQIEALNVRFPRVACYQGTATRLVEQLPADLTGVLVYIDGPYHGDGSRKITGYKFGGCSREEQLAMAADCHRRGARVAMSEAVPLAAELRALTGDEWWQVDITEHRNGQARTFGNTREYVTLNRAPAHVPGQQQGLFGGAS